MERLLLQRQQRKTHSKQQYPYVAVLRNMQYTPPTFCIYLCIYCIYHQTIKFNLKSNTGFVSTGYVSHG